MNPKYGIVAPIGGFGNHLRWLALLDESFTHPTFFLKGTPAERVGQIIHNAYPNSRTWHNWLRNEWKFREHADALIQFSHDLVSSTYCIGVTISPELAYKSYVKLNSSLNNVPAKHFKKEIRKFNNTILDCSQVINGDTLFAEALNAEAYNQLITTFNLDDNYDQASILHNHWYEQHKKTEQEIVRDLAELYNITEL